MHWDVVEVKPEPDYCLFVRFRDGLSGRVRFRPEELSGALAPLREPQFFNRVFIDHDWNNMMPQLVIARIDFE